MLHNGVPVVSASTTGAQVIGIANELDAGVVICGYRLSDMQYREINNYLPRGFEMLLIASKKRLEDAMDSNLVCLSMPLKTQDLLDTLKMMSKRSLEEKRSKEKKARQLEEKKAVIQEAKERLMERNHMTEQEAYHYIRKHSMDSGTNMTEMAEMILLF